MPEDQGFNIEKLIDSVVEKSGELVTEFGWKILAALAIFIVGKLIARWLTSLMRKALTNDKLNATVVGFLCNLTYIVLLTVVILAALTALGVNVMSFMAILGAAGLAVGLALQGSLANFAAGVLLVFFQPFKAGDVVEVAGEFGTVMEIQLFCTIIKTPQNVTIIIPNNAAASSNIKNYTREGTIRLDMVFGIAYDGDIRDAKALIRKIVDADERIIKDPGPTLGVLSLGDNSVNIACNVWIKPADKWGVLFDANENVKYALDEAGIGIPFPQRDVHLYVEKGQLPG